MNDNDIKAKLYSILADHDVFNTISNSIIARTKAEKLVNDLYGLFSSQPSVGNGVGGSGGGDGYSGSSHMVGSRVFSDDEYSAIKSISDMRIKEALAQLGERGTYTSEVDGSSPSRLTDTQLQEVIKIELAVKNIIANERVRIGEAVREWWHKSKSDRKLEELMEDLTGINSSSVKE